ncbi:MAG: hypothetical protein NVS9B1_13470 [Candidatus Dormibacteraceae bacterium]
MITRHLLLRRATALAVAGSTALGALVYLQLSGGVVAFAAGLLGPSVASPATDPTSGLQPPGQTPVLATGPPIVRTGGS